MNEDMCHALITVVGIIALVCVAIFSDVFQPPSRPSYNEDEVESCRIESGKMVLETKNGSKIVAEKFRIEVEK